MDVLLPISTEYSYLTLSILCILWVILRSYKIWSFIINLIFYFNGLVNLTTCLSESSHGWICIFFIYIIHRVVFVFFTSFYLRIFDGVLQLPTISLSATKSPSTHTNLLVSCRSNDSLEMSSIAAAASYHRRSDGLPGDTSYEATVEINSTLKLTHEELGS